MGIDLQNRINFHGQSDDSIPPRHTFICGVTGSGKTTAMKHEPDILKAKRKVYWDPDKAHQIQGQHIESLPEFWLELQQAMASGLAFDLAVSVANTRENFQIFCMCLVRVACCTTPITALIEEVHQCTGNAEAEGYWSDLLTRVRKYGVRLVVISPRPQQCDKTTVTSCNIKYVCKLGRHPDRQYMANELGLTPADIDRLGRLNGTGKVHWWYQGESGDPVACQYSFKNMKKSTLSVEHFRTGAGF